jgi:predicted nucleic acid-binding protein
MNSVGRSRDLQQKGSRQIVLDSNILFSALVRDSLTRRMMIEYDGLFLFPGFILDEVWKHKDEILKKTGMPVDVFEALLRLLLNQCVIVDGKFLKDFEQEARDIVKDIDEDDFIFFACALAYPGSVIWSDDRMLKRQGVVRVLNTAEMMVIMQSL